MMDLGMIIQSGIDSLRYDLRHVGRRIDEVEEQQAQMLGMQDKMEQKSNAVEQMVKAWTEKKMRPSTRRASSKRRTPRLNNAWTSRIAECESRTLRKRRAEASSQDVPGQRRNFAAVVFEPDEILTLDNAAVRDR